MPGMLMSERIRISDSSTQAATRDNASGAELAKSMTNRCARMSRRNCWRNRASTSGSSSTTRTRTLIPEPLYQAFAGQADDELGEFTRKRFYFDAATVLFDDDVVAHGKAEPGPFT